MDSVADTSETHTAVEPVDLFAPFAKLTRLDWNWGLLEFATHLGKDPDDTWVRSQFMMFNNLCAAIKDLGEQTIVRLLEAP